TLSDSAVALGQGLVGLAPRILGGNTIAEEVTDLSGQVNLMASGHQAKLERVDPVADSAVAGRLHRVTLRAAFDCDVRGLSRILQALEFGKVALSLQDIRITAVDVASLDQSPEVVRIEMTVTGWFLGGPDAIRVTQGTRTP